MNGSTLQVHTWHILWDGEKYTGGVEAERFFRSPRIHIVMPLGASLADLQNEALLQVQPLDPLRYHVKRHGRRIYGSTEPPAVAPNSVGSVIGIGR